MTVDFTDPYYYLFPLMGIAFFVILYFLLRGRSARVQNVVLFALLAANFALHFLKLLFPPYSTDDFDYAVQTITPENVCAINTMIFPFLFLKKGGALRDYMFYIGAISGIAASWLPMSIEQSVPFDFDCMRYYFCHTVLWAVPVLMVVLGRHKLDYRRIIFTPLIYILDLVVIVFNEVLLVALGLESMNNLFSLSVGNGGMAFGPYESLEGTAILDFLLNFVPPFFKPSELSPHYAPALYQLFPVIIFGCPLGFLMCLYWEHAHFAGDVKKLWLRIRGALNKYRFARRRINYGGARRCAADVRRVRYKRGAVWRG